MIIIGEKINASRKAIAAAIAARDEAHIVKTAQEQLSAGATYLDVNGGDPRPGAEVANMEWLVNLVQANTSAPLCIDSANPEAIEKGLSLAKAKPIVNSISLEKDRIERFLPIVAKHPCMVVALCMADGGMPTGADDRVQRAAELIERLTGVGKQVDEIIVDPCFMPVSAQADSGKAVLDAMAEIRRRWPKVHIGGGLSNTSYGLPLRKYINLAMMAAGVSRGMDTAIVDPTIPYMMAMILAGEVITGADEWCANYVSASREGKLA